MSLPRAHVLLPQGLGQPLVRERYPCLNDHAPPIPNRISTCTGIEDSFSDRLSVGSSRGEVGYLVRIDCIVCRQYYEADLYRIPLQLIDLGTEFALFCHIPKV